jgi:hypothetical protein
MLEMPIGKRTPLKLLMNNVKIAEYPDSRIQKGGSVAVDGGISVSAASASFSLKGEDFYTISLATEEPRLGKHISGMTNVLIFTHSSVLTLPLAITNTNSQTADS